MVPIAVLAFVVLGLTESGLGTAWPAMRRDIGRPVEDLGTLLAFGLVAYASSSAIAGRLVHRIGTGGSVVLAGGASLLGLLTFATAGSWVAVLVAGVLVGLGGGMLDSTVNAHAAHHFTAGAMNLLHAGFGIGATLGPLVMAVAIAQAAGWQAGYAVYVAAQAVMLLLLFSVRRNWAAAPPPPKRSVEGNGLDAVVVSSLAMFFLYTGIEVAAGQWSFSVLTEDRGLSTQAGGSWVAAYWGGLTVGRLALSALADRLGPSRVLTLSMAGSLIATAWFWWDVGGFGLIGLPALGLSLAGVFPTLVTLTPSRIGSERTTVMVGYQLAAASVGAAALPWLVGRVVAVSSLASVAPFLLGASVAMAALNAWLGRRSAQALT